MKIVDGGVTAAQGFKATGIRAGIKKGGKKIWPWYTAKTVCGGR